MIYLPPYWLLLFGGGIILIAIRANVLHEDILLLLSGDLDYIIING
jgi:hypothetical protein